MAGSRVDEERDGVELTHLDQPLFDGAGVTKRQLVDYLDAVADRIIPELRDRPLSVIRTTGQEPFMQKNVPKYTPDWVAHRAAVGRGVEADASLRALQRPADAAVVRQPAGRRVPPDAGAAPTASTTPRTSCSTSTRRPTPTSRPPSRAAQLVRRALDDVGLAGAVKTSGAKGVHVFVPITAHASLEDAAAATRAIARRAERLDPSIATTAFVKDDREGKVFVDATRAGGATVVAAYSPRARPGRAGVVPGLVGRARARAAGATSRSSPPSIGSATPTRGPRPSRRRNGSRPTSSPRATRSRSPAWRRCTRASAGRVPAGPG